MRLKTHHDQERQRPEAAGDPGEAAVGGTGRPASRALAAAPDQTKPATSPIIAPSRDRLAATRHS